MLFFLEITSETRECVDIDSFQVLGLFLLLIHWIVNYPIQWITKAIDLWTTRTCSFVVTKLDAFWFVRHVSKWSWSSSKYSSLTTILLQNCMQLNPFQLSGIVRFSLLSYSTIIKHKDIGHKWGKRGYFLPTLRDIKVYCQMISIFKGSIQSWQKHIYASCPGEVLTNRSHIFHNSFAKIIILDRRKISD